MQPCPSFGIPKVASRRSIRQTEVAFVQAEKVSYAQQAIVVGSLINQAQASLQAQGTSRQVKTV